MSEIINAQSFFENRRKQILDCYNQYPIIQKSDEDIDIEKGGVGSGRKIGQIVKIKRNGFPDYHGVIHSSDKDDKYYHIRSETGDLNYVHHKDISDISEEQSEKVKTKMQNKKFADGKSYYSEFEKSEDIDLEKGGEGSRGGKVIGHTRSGKPIYQMHKKFGESIYKKDENPHKDFTKEDHEDAVKVHENWGKNNIKGINPKLKISNNNLDIAYHIGKVSNNIKKSEETNKETDNIVHFDENGKPIYAKEFDPGKQDFVELVKSEETEQIENSDDLEKALDILFQPIEFDLDLIEKGRGKTAQIGEIREFGGRKHVKHADGWVILNKKDGVHKFYDAKTRSTSEPTDEHIAHAKKHLGEHVENKVEDKKEEDLKQENYLENYIKKLPEQKDSTIYALKAGKVSSKNFLNNEYVDIWGKNTSYFLIDDKYIIAGSGKPEEYIGKNLQMRLVDDGNRTTKFESAYIKHYGVSTSKYYQNNHARKRKVTVFADSAEEFSKLLPKGNYGLYTMK